MRLWQRARELAARTPPARNRYVDFLRAASILVVVIGHWVMAAPQWVEGELRIGDMLHVAPWTRWLTWLFQVMPVFFIVGGWSNAASWAAAQRDGVGYGAWTAGRLRRLVEPIVPLVLFWAVFAVVAGRLGVRPLYVQAGSQGAFLPTWFLAVYVMVVVLAPVTWWAWRRFGMASFWGLAVGAAVVDAAAFAGGLEGLRWANYAFVWLGVHQLGYLWREDRLAGPARALAWAAGGLAALVVLVAGAGYPVSMITVPGQEVSNSRPPTFALLALGVFHAGLLLAAEAPARRWLRSLRAWTATVLVNGMIMTVYLWHLTVMVLAIGLLNLLGGPGLRLTPGTAVWWAARPLWVAGLSLGLAVAIPIFNRLERGARGGPSVAVPAWRPAAGAAAVCAGLALLAIGGIVGDGPLGLRLGPLALFLAGSGLILGLPQRQGTRTRAG